MGYLITMLDSLNYDVITLIQLLLSYKFIYSLSKCFFYIYIYTCIYILYITQSDDDSTTYIPNWIMIVFFSHDYDIYDALLK